MDFSPFAAPASFRIIPTKVEITDDAAIYTFVVPKSSSVLAVIDHSRPSVASNVQKLSNNKSYLRESNPLQINLDGSFFGNSIDPSHENFPCDCDCATLVPSAPITRTTLIASLRKEHPTLLARASGATLFDNLPAQISQRAIHNALQIHQGKIIELIAPFIHDSAEAVISELARRGQHPHLTHAPIASAAASNHADIASALAHHLGRVAVNAKLPSSQIILQGVGNISGATPLFIASALNHHHVASVLLSAGADTETRSDYGWTPLTVAAFQNSIDTMQVLISANANVNAVDPDGKTPLLHATVRAHSQACRILIQSGASIEAKHPSTGMTPLIYAANLGLPNIVALLLASGANENARDNSGWSALFHAAANDHIDVIDVLSKPVQASGKHLSFSYNPNQLDSQLLTPLHRAAEKGHLRACQRLINSGALINPTDPAGRSPLTLAAHAGHTSICYHLVQSGAPIDHRDRSNRTPLMIACKHNRMAVASTLIELGANINASDAYGVTPLIYAAHSGHDSICSMLIQNGADRSITDSDGHSAEWHAQTKSRSAVIKLFASLQKP